MGDEQGWEFNESGVKSVEVAAPFVDYCESFGLKAGVPKAFDASSICGLQIGVVIELSKALDGEFMPVGLAVIGLSGAKTVTASFEPRAPLAVGVFGGDATDKVYPRLSKEMSAIAQGFLLWDRSQELASLALLHAGAGPKEKLASELAEIYEISVRHPPM